MDKIIDRIKGAKSILISTHVNPDSDGLGAGIALMEALRKLGKNVEFVTQDRPPKNLSFLQGIDEIKSMDEAKKDYDLAIVVDSATFERIGATEQLMAGMDVINIDHHISNPKYGDLYLVEYLSSTCEIMYNFIKKLGVEIDLPMAYALYSGIVNDTGNFAHDNVTEATLEIAGKLVGKGVKNSIVVRELFHNKSYAGLKIQGDAFSHMVFVPEKRFVYYYLPYEKLVEFGGTKEDTEGIVERINSLEGSNVSLFLRGEKDGTIKGSMRSKEDTDVNAIASIFGGGGHQKAAGFSSELPAEEIIRLVEEKL